MLVGDQENLTQALFRNQHLQSVFVAEC